MALFNWFKKKEREGDETAETQEEASVGEEEVEPGAPESDSDGEREAGEAAAAEREEGAVLTEEAEERMADADEAAQIAETAAPEETREEDETAEEPPAKLPGEEAVEAPTPETEEPAKRGMFSRLRRGLSKTRGGLVDSLKSAIGVKRKVDEELLEEIEDILIQSDVGVRSTDRIIERLRTEGRKREAQDVDTLTALVRETVEEILETNQRPLRLDAEAPQVLLFVGVNGTGKTTTIGKMALEFRRQGKKVLLVAADTFRAAAVEQLEIWARRTESEFVSRGEGADPASVCFDGLEQAREHNADIVLIDTAGRLHNKKHLMAELTKAIRVIRKTAPEAPHEIILVLDATTGQNAMAQVEIFREAAEISGLVMTKLDGTAKGGILIAIKQAHELPIFKIGIGEAPEDLRDFDAREFADALFDGRN